MNKKELAEALAEKNHLSKLDAEEVISSLTEIMTKTISEGEKIVIPSFGTFDISERPARDGRNPQTGERIKIEASRTVRFKPGKALKESVNH